MRLLTIPFLLLAHSALAQDGSALFTAKACAVCHSIGVDPPHQAQTLLGEKKTAIHTQSKITAKKH